MKIFILLLFVLNSIFGTFPNPPKEIIRIMNSGDGKSIETAYKVYSVDEEYDLLNYLKLKSTMQKLHIRDGFFYDEIKTQSNTIYFKIIVKKLIKNEQKLVS